MMLAQQLYEGIDLKRQGTIGLITICVRILLVYLTQQKLRRRIILLINTVKVYFKIRQLVNKGDQDAHEAIRPTSALRTPDDALRTPDDMKPYLTRDQHRLYKLIWERFVASQMAPAILDYYRVRRHSE